MLILYLCRSLYIYNFSTFRGSGRNLSIDNGDIYVLDKKVLIQNIVSSTVILKSQFPHFKHLCLIL